MLFYYYMEQKRGEQMDIVFVKELKKYYGLENNLTKALDGVTLEIYKGEFVAIVGRSGSGKTTLLNIIGGLDRPTSGEVYINGQSLKSMKDEELTVFRRKHIGFIFQNYNLMPILNVTENITLPLVLDNKKIDNKYFEEVITELNLSKKLTSMPNELSGGEQQRVAIARALITKPDIILADEPTGNLDTKNSEDVINLLHISSQKFDQTIVLITHNQIIARGADRIIEISDGKIIERRKA